MDGPPVIFICRMKKPSAMKRQDNNVDCWRSFRKSGSRENCGAVQKAREKDQSASGKPISVAVAAFCRGRDQVATACEQVF